jgi:hypothetical protein
MKSPARRVLIAFLMGVALLMEHFSLVDEYTYFHFKRLE